MNTYKVDKEIYKYLKGILTRSYHEFSFQKKEDGSWLCITRINEKNFGYLLERARCEKKSEEDGVFYLTRREHDNLVLGMLLRKVAGATSSANIDDPMFERSIH